MNMWHSDEFVNICGIHQFIYLFIMKMIFKVQYKHIIQYNNLKKWAKSMKCDLLPHTLLDNSALM